MIVINNIDANYFELNGKRYNKIYQPLAQGDSNIGIYNIFDVRQQLLNSTPFDEFTIDSINYNSQVEVINALLPVIHSTVTSGNGGGSSDDLLNHLNDYTNPHLVTKYHIGLDDVENIAPSDMPISEATQNALDIKSDISQTGRKLISDQALATISLLDADDNILDTLSVGFLNNEGTTLEYSATSETIVIKNDAGEILSSIPVSSFLSNLPHNINLNGSTLELRDSTNSVLSSVVFEIENINNLGSKLEDIYVEIENNNGLINQHISDTNNPHQLSFSDLISTGHTHLGTEANIMTLYTLTNSNTLLVNSHTGNTDNPHNVTASQLGLSDVATSGDYNDLINTPTNIDADTLDGLHSNDFVRKTGYINETITGFKQFYASDDNAVISVTAAAPNRNGYIFGTGRYGFFDYSPNASNGVRISALKNIRLGLNNDHSYGTGITFNEILRIAENNNVGIGTATPSEKLDVDGKGVFSDRLTVNRDGLSSIGMQGVAQTNGWAYRFTSGGLPNYSGLYFNNSNNSHYILRNNLGEIKTQLQAVGSSYITGGNLGVGTETPSEKLDVNGNIKGVNLFGTGNLKIDGSGIFENPINSRKIEIISGNGNIDYTGNGDFYLNRFSTTNISANVGGGNFGIGTSSPTEKLVVDGNVKAESFKINNNATTDSWFKKEITYGSSSGGWARNVVSLENVNNSNDILNLGVLGNGTAYTYSFLGFGTYSSPNNLRITPDGNFGVGITPSEKLEVNGNIKVHKIEASLEDNTSFTGTSVVYNTNNNRLELAQKTNFQTLILDDNVTGELKYKIVNDRLIIYGSVTADSPTSNYIGQLNSSYYPSRFRSTLVYDNSITPHQFIIDADGTMYINSLSDGVQYNIDVEFTLNIED